MRQPREDWRDNWGLPRKPMKALRHRPPRKRRAAAPPEKVREWNDRSKERHRAATVRWWIKKLNAAIDAARSMRHDD